MDIISQALAKPGWKYGLTIIQFQDWSAELSGHHSLLVNLVSKWTVSIQEFSPVMSAKHRHGRGLIICKPGMLKLGLGIDANKTGHLCTVKRKMRSDVSLGRSTYGTGCETCHKMSSTWLIAFTWTVDSWSDSGLLLEG